MVIALKDQDGETQDKIHMRNQAKKTHHTVIMSKEQYT